MFIVERNANRQNKVTTLTAYVTSLFDEGKFDIHCR